MNPNGLRETSVTIPDHDLIKLIGKGEYGVVWLARNALGGYRAVKIIDRGAFDDERPYEREFSAIRVFEPISRTHPSQIDILHVGRNDPEGYFYYVMELADPANGASRTLHSPNADASKAGTKTKLLHPTSGVDTLELLEAYLPRTLKSDIKGRGSLPAAECVDIGLALANALDHLHENGLVHRDVKPSNIIFINGIPKLADIGLVTRIDATRSLVGTELYMPLEGSGTIRADLYALGKVLYEISTGKSPSEYPELPEEWRGREDREALLELNEVIVKACAADPKQRYPSAKQLAADLNVIKSGGSVKRARYIERFLTGVRRSAFPIGIFAALAIAAYVYNPWASAPGVFRPDRMPSYYLYNRFDDGIGVAGVDYVDRPDRPTGRIQAVSGGLLTEIGSPNKGIMYELFLDGSREFLPFEHGKVLEVSVDVIEHGPDQVAVQFGVGDYIFGKTDSVIALVKESKPEAHNVPIFWEETSTKRKNIRMVFQLTPENNSARIQLQIIDLDTSPSKVLFSREVIDTPGQDAVTPLPASWMSNIEYKTAPRIGNNCRFFLGVYNFSEKPIAEALFDNLEVRVY